MQVDRHFSLELVPVLNARQQPRKLQALLKELGKAIIASMGSQPSRSIIHYYRL